MKLVAGVDIGNATTETAIARIDGKNVTFLRVVLQVPLESKERNRTYTEFFSH